MTKSLTRSNESEKPRFSSLRNGVEQAAASIADNTRSTQADRQAYVDLVKSQSSDKFQFIVSRRVRAG